MSSHVSIVSRAKRGYALSATQELHLLTDIKLSIRELQVQITKVLQSQQADNLNIDYTVPDGLTIPVDNKKVLDLFEEALEEKSEFQKYLVVRATHVISITNEDCVKTGAESGAPYT